MKAKDITQLLANLGISLSTQALAVLALALPLVLAGGMLLYKEYRKRAEKKAQAGPDVAAVAGRSAPAAQIPSSQLSKPWRRFLGRLPGNYQRSILNFEHFIVMGAASAGKSRLLDTQTDWSYQTQQVAREGTLDPDLPTYLASGAVITELPSRYLEDTSENCRRALDRLWRPLYRQRTPTVVVALDAAWLSTSPPEARRDLALAVRMKVNQLSQIRGRPIEVRLALTHLDQLEGFDAAARFWAGQGISNRITFAPSGHVEASLEAWEHETRVQTPRALRALDSEQFHRFIAFLRNVPALLTPLALFADILYEPDPITKAPLRGGAYLCSDAAGSGSPLSNAAESGPGPNPLREHFLIAAGVAALMVAYFGLAYEHERALWAPAADKMASYRVSRELVGSEHELAQRSVIREFTVNHRGLMTKFPGFFASVREDMRGKLAARIREGLLLPQTAEVAQHGIVGPDGMTLRWRRTVYCLALLHSYEDDLLHILQEPKLGLFSSMTGLRTDIIDDYVRSSSVPYRTPLQVKLGYAQIDKYDTTEYWSKLPNEMVRAMADGSVGSDELGRLRAQATEMRLSLPRFEHDEYTLELLKNIDTAVEAAGDRHGGYDPGLRAAYEPIFADLISSVKQNDIRGQFPRLEQLTTLVASAPQFIPDQSESAPLLSALADDLIAVEHKASKAPASGRGRGLEPIRLKLGGEQFDIDVGRWDQVLHNSRAEALIDDFLARDDRESLFFSAKIDDALPDVKWNPLATNGALFEGSSRLRGRYTRAGFERYVRREILRIVDIVGPSSISLDHKKRLADLIRAEVASYARNYRAEASSFIRGFRLHAPTIEALRVVLGQISTAGSTFDEFLLALDQNTNLNLEGASPSAEAGAAATKPGDDAKPAAPAAAASSAKPSDAAKPSSSATPANGAKPGGPTESMAAEAAASAGLSAKDLLAPMAEPLKEFGSWHNAVGGKSGGAELGKFKEIIKQLLSDLTAISADPPPGKAEPAVVSLDGELTPAGKTALAALRADKGSYEAMARQWVGDAGLTSEQQGPFLEPFDALEALGHRDLESVVARAWYREMWPLVQDISAKFPFDRRADVAADPAEIKRLFHPIDGEFTQLVARYIQPLSSGGGGAELSPAKAAAGVAFPPSLFRTVNAVAAMTERLWDDKGSPRRLVLRVAHVPMVTARRAKLVPSEVFLQAGEASVLNFNQKPGTSTVLIDWTSDESAQLGIHVLEVETREVSFPAPLVAGGPNWRFLRLLQLARVSALPTPAGAQSYEWQLRLTDGGADKVPVRITLLDDPWAVFALPSGLGAVRGR